MRPRILAALLCAFVAKAAFAVDEPSPRASLRVSSERYFEATFESNLPARLRFSPRVLIRNDQPADLIVALKSDGNWREQVAFVRLEVRSEDDAACLIAPVDNRPVEARGMAVLHTGEEQVFALPSEYEVNIPRPGRYQIRIAVAFGSLHAGDKQVFVTSPPFEIEVQAKLPASKKP